MNSMRVNVATGKLTVFPSSNVPGPWWAHAGAVIEIKAIRSAAGRLIVIPPNAQATAHAGRGQGLHGNGYRDGRTATLDLVAALAVKIRITRARAEPHCECRINQSN